MSTYAKDILERVIASFAGGMVAVIGATGVDLTDGKVWLGGALAGAVAVLKALAARLSGDKRDASLIK